MKNLLTIISPTSFLFCFLLLASSAQAALVAHFRLEEGSVDPTTNITYSAVSSDTGTLVTNISGLGAFDWATTGLGPVPSPGTTAALHFISLANGLNGSPHVETTIFTGDASSNNLAGPGPKTITAWIKPQILSGGTNDLNPTIVQMGAASPNGARVTFKGVVSGSTWQLRAEFQGSGKTGTKNLNDSSWHLVALVLSTNSSGTAAGSNAVLYVDGAVEPISVSSGPAVNISVYTNYQVIVGSGFGAAFGGGDRGFTGLIDDVRIYNEALTSADILNIYLGPGSSPAVTQLSGKSFVLGSTNSTIAFTAGAVGTPPFNITWKKNGTVLSGQTSDTLTISPATVADLGTYTVAVTNAYGGTSKTAVLALNTAPIKPPRQAVLLGHPATFSVTMPSDSSGYTYQWRSNGVAISGATASALTIPNASSTDADTNYQVVVTLGGNSATSTPAASLAILSVPSSAYAQAVLTDGPAGYWRLGETNGSALAVDATSYYSGGYSNYSGTELESPGALTNDANTCSAFTTANYVQVPYDFELTRSDGLTLEVWVNPASIGTRQSLVSCYGNLPILGYELFINTAGQPAFRTYRSTSPAGPTFDDLTGSDALTQGVWTHLVATYDGSNKRLFINGYPEIGRSTVYFPAVNIPIRFAAGGVAAPLDSFSGNLDEVAIYSKPLTWAQVAGHYIIGSGLTPTSDPPALNITPSGSDLMLTWDHNWVLQSNSALDGSAGAWTNVAGPPVSPYTVSLTNSQTLFRLVLP